MAGNLKHEENLTVAGDNGCRLSCPVCETYFSSDVGRFVRIRNYLYRRCQNCRSYVLDPLPSDKDLEKFYGDPDYYRDLYGDYYFESLQASYRNFRKWFGYVEPLISCQQDRLVEIGSGAGTFLKVLIDSGYTNVAGYEMQPAALQETRKRGLPVFPQNLFADEDAIDVLFLFDVIEHITDPSAFLESMSNTVKKDGLIVLETSCNRRFVSRMLGRFWWFLIPPNHVMIYNIQSLERLLSRLNYKVIKTVKINYHWISLSNALAKVRNRFPVFKLKIHSRYPSKELLFPFFHFTSFLTIARKVS